VTGPEREANTVPQPCRRLDMSVNITLPPTSQLSGPEEDSEFESSSDGNNEEETFSDWLDDDAEAPTLSLFDETTHPSALKAVAHDREVHGVDVVQIGNSLSEWIVFELLYRPNVVQNLIFSSGSG
jgi:hypothetical protein